MEHKGAGSSAARSLADPKRQAKLAAVRARARESDEWRRARRLLSTLCLFTGHLRPAAHEAAHAFGHQGPVPTPGSSMSPEVAEVREIREQIRCAKAFEHPGFVGSPNLPQDNLRACEWLCEHRDDVSGARLKRLEQLRGALDGLSRWSEEYRACAAEHVRGYKPPPLHVAAVDCLADAMGWPDSLLVEHATLGCPPVGEQPDSGTFKLKEEPAAMDILELDNDAWLDELVKRVAADGGRAGTRADHEALWARTQEEVADGWATPVGNIKDVREKYKAEIAAGRCRPMQRFSVLQKGSLRPCDNARHSLHNACTSLHETVTHETADFPARAAAVFYELLGEGDWSMFLGTEDVASAYRRATCSEPGLTMFAQWNHHTSSVEFFELQGFNFGLRSAVLWFNRLANFMCVSSRVTRTAGVAKAVTHYHLSCSPPRTAACRGALPPGERGELRRRFRAVRANVLWPERARRAARFRTVSRPTVQRQREEVAGDGAAPLFLGRGNRFLALPQPAAHRV